MLNKNELVFFRIQGARREHNVYVTNEQRRRRKKVSICSAYLVYVP